MRFAGLAVPTILSAAIATAMVLLVVAGADAAPPPAARIHFESGKAYYAEGKWDDASREFRAAYDLSKYPDLLLDVARAETRAGHEDEALGFLERYLAVRPDAEDSPAVRSELEARRKEKAERENASHAEQERARAEEERKHMADTAVAEKQHADAAAAAAATAADKQREAEAAARGAQVGRVRIPGILLACVGVAAIGGGVGAGVSAQQQASTVSGGGAPGGVGTPVKFSGSQFAAAESSGHNAQIASIALYAVGAAALVAGAGLLAWSFKLNRGRPTAWLAPVFAPSQAGLVLGGGF